MRPSTPRVVRARRDGDPLRPGPRNRVGWASPTLSAPDGASTRARPPPRRANEAGGRCPPDPTGDVPMAGSRDATDYQSYRGLPSLAGLATVADAARPGLGVEA